MSPLQKRIEVERRYYKQKLKEVFEQDFCEENFMKEKT